MAKLGRTPWLLGILFVLLAAAAWWWNRPAPVVDTGSTTADFRTVMGDLAAQTKQNLGAADDFSVLVTDNAMPIGTVLRVSSTVPVDDESCVALPEPTKRNSPSFAPSVTMSRKLAGSFGLADVVPVLGGSKMGAERSDELELSFQNVGYRLLTDARLAALLAKPECRNSFGNEPRWVIRGYVEGARRLIIRNARDNTLAADIESVSNFDASASGNSELTMIDPAEVPFLQLVSLVQPPKAGEAPVVASAAATVPTAATGQLYIQRDSADQASNAKSAAASFESSGIAVASGIEAIASDKMPSTAQIRYFNDSDRAKAQQAADAIRGDYPDVQVVRVGLPAPTGQLEAWLTSRSAEPAAGAARRSAAVRAPTAERAQRF